MVTQVHATYVNGVLKPDVALGLADNERVQLTIESTEDRSSERSRQALQSIEARLAQRPIHGGGIRFTRDQLHERR